jgi:hypothetical protein
LTTRRGSEGARWRQPIGQIGHLGTMTTCPGRSAATLLNVRNVTAKTSLIVEHRHGSTKESEVNEEAHRTSNDGKHKACNLGVRPMRHEDEWLERSLSSTDVYAAWALVCALIFGLFMFSLG